MSKYHEIEINKVKSISIKNRVSKVNVSDFAITYHHGMSFKQFWNSLPKILVGAQFHEFVTHVVKAHRQNKPFIWMMGAHPIKCGLNPIIIDLMEKGVITALATNGAGAIHDVELAYWGQTSEDVTANLQNGSFGMVKETAEIINETISLARKKNLGYGEALGQRISQDLPPYCHLSLLAKGYQLNLPVTVHVGLGTDIMHQHPNADGAAIGELSLRDFRILAQIVTQLGGKISTDLPDSTDSNHGGIVANVGSCVILPEVFLKALTVARNLGYEVTHFYTANFDMLPHYRPRVNVVQRPTMAGGKGYNFTGHHEIMIPLLAAAIIETLEELATNHK
ncbi:MAG: hypothetical protein J7J44_04195 [Deltaproteobacteria bacterium]|nr:hypothetical protein [Deltaproteobacteria bacterium]